MGNRFKILAVLTLSGMAFAASASAQTICRGPALTPGATIHGPVLDVPDDTTLCVANGASPSQWTAVSLPRLNASRPVLMAAAFGQNATCTMDAKGVADCKVEGVSLAAQISRPEIIKAAIQWRDRRQATGPTQFASNAR